jgi:hypothetical protein
VSTRFARARALVLALTTALVASSPARAADAPAPTAPAPRPKIAQPYLDSLVGSWDVSVDVGGATMTGTSRWWKALDGTAMVEDFTVGQGDHQFFGFGVILASAGGKEVKHWWFDSEGRGEVQVTKGPLRDDGYVAEGEFGGTTMGSTMKKTADGHEFTMTRGGQVLVKVAYRKAKAAHDWTPVVEARKAKHPVIEALIGDWTVKGSYTTGDAKVPHEGRTSWRYVAGGAYTLHEYAVTRTGEAPVEALTVSSLTADGTRERTWLFGRYFEAPHYVTGTFTDDTYVGRCEESPFGPFTVTLRLTPEGVKAEQDFPTLKGKVEETYTRAK